MTTWVRQSPSLGDDFEQQLAPLRPLLAGLAADPGLTADVVLLVESRPLGAWTELGAKQVAEVAAAGCGLVIDAYDGDPEPEQ